MSPQPYADFTRQYIDGAWRDGRSATVVRDLNPFNGETLLAIKGASGGDVDDAFAAAVAAQGAWAALTPRERAGYLIRAAASFDQRHEEIVGWLTREAGATRFWAEQISRHAAICCSEAAGYAQQAQGVILPSLLRGQQSHVHRKPVGVVSVLTPWNSPINLTLRAIAPALALGNAVVLKPASETPVSGGLFHAKVFEEVGLPKGLFNVVVGAASEIGDAVSAHPLANAVSFTGSTSVGRGIIALNAQSPTIKRVGLELGGNAPLTVLDDANLDAAAGAIVFGRFLHQGQICMSVNRVLADARIHDVLALKLLARIKALPYGDPADPKTVVGPLMTQKAVRGVVAKIE